MDSQVEVIASGRPYRGRIITVREDRLKFCGQEMGREVVEHPGAAAILAWEGDCLVMVKQYRHPVSEVLWEIPAGLLEPGERPLDCARRELAEETGFKGGEWRFLLQFYSTPGFCNETIYLYEARGL
ncbi:MAG: NUDIX hydrolase, partial [Firmicutes bacterium]|nr:NUDIX hydrolase [Bacillota bacterium]